MLFSYEVLINVAIGPGGVPKASLLRRGEACYAQGDALVRTWRGEMRADDAFAAAEAVAVRHNLDSRPDGLIGPQFSAGDVVVLVPLDAPGVAVAFTALNGLGIEAVPVPRPASIEMERSWSEVVADSPVSA